METKFLLFICLTILIQVSLQATQYYAIADLKKYDKTTVQGGNGAEKFIIFDSSEFSKGDKIYFKITADNFESEEIYFEFFDDPNDYTPKSRWAPEYPTSTSESRNSITKYYNIEKSSRNLGSLEGKYLVIYFWCYGNIEIENVNNEDALMISLIVVGVVIVGAVVVFIICYCIRKRRNAAMMGNGYGTENVQVVNNNYGQQPVPNYQNNNMNMNMNANNAYAYNNGYNNGY